MDGTGEDYGWKSRGLRELAGMLSEKAFEALEMTHLHTLGELQEKFTRHGQFWAKELGVHGRHREAIENALTAYVTDWVNTAADRGQQSEAAA